jgi:hypothetical protein
LRLRAAFGAIYDWERGAWSDMHDLGPVSIEFPKNIPMKIPRRKDSAYSAAGVGDACCVNHFNKPMKIQAGSMLINPSKNRS